MRIGPSTTWASFSDKPGEGTDSQPLSKTPISSARILPVAGRHFTSSLPLNRPRRFAGDIKANAIHAFDFVDDATGKLFHEFVGQLHPIGGHSVLRFDRADRNREIIRPLITHDANT